MTYNAPFNVSQLLISVRNAGEAALAAQSHVAWIDVKDPASGSLGMPQTAVCREIVSELGAHSEIQTSVALGELWHVDYLRVAELMALFSIGKVGLAGCDACGNAELLDKLLELQSHFPSQARLVPAIYADYRRAESPEPDRVLRLAEQLASPYLLIDTWHKDGSGLFDWCAIDTLLNLKQGCERFGAQLVVAGSLRVTDWTRLEQLGAVIVGIRGAVCQTSSDRSSNLCPDKVDQWQAWSSSIMR